MVRLTFLRLRALRAVKTTASKTPSPSRSRRAAATAAYAGCWYGQWISRAAPPLENCTRATIRNIRPTRRAMRLTPRARGDGGVAPECSGGGGGGGGGDEVNEDSKAPMSA